MKIAVASDHAGYPLKGRIIDELRRFDHQVTDFGADSAEPSDYPDFAHAVARAIQEGAVERGILVCGSGAGACVAANKFFGVRAATCHDIFSARQAVEDDGLNVLCLGARVIGAELASELVRAFASASFSGAERHRRRLEKVRRFEENFCRKG
jgi:ribose 5-phosphate isomerase B